MLNEMANIYKAIKEGSEEKVRDALKQRATLQRTETRELLITWAIEQKAYHLVPVLHNNARVWKGDPDRHGTWPLALMCKNEKHFHLDTFNFILDHGEDINKKDSEHRTVLHFAAMKSNVPAVRALLARGANINCQTKTEWCSPLHLIPKYDDLGGAEDILRLLLEHNADVNLPNKDGQSPIYACIRNANRNFVNIMLEHGADVNHLDESNRTPLHLAVSSVTPEDGIIQLLMANDTVINACDRYGFTPLSLKLSCLLEPTNFQIECMLIQHGAIVQDPKVLQSLVLRRTESGMLKVLHIMLLAGLRQGLVLRELAQIESRAKRVETAAETVAQKEALIRLCKEPLSLQCIARIAIRQEIQIHTNGSSIFKYFDTLQIPGILKDFLTCPLEPLQ